MLKKSWGLALSLSALVTLGGCDSENRLVVERTAETPMTVELNDLQVEVYRKETVIKQDPRCGYTFVGTYPIPNTCPVDEFYHDRTEKISLRVNFPVGTQLTGDQKESFTGEFYNDYDHPELNYGFIDIKAKSRYNKYDADSLKGIQVIYGAVTDVNPVLKP